MDNATDITTQEVERYEMINNTFIEGLKETHDKTPYRIWCVSFQNESVKRFCDVKNKHLKGNMVLRYYNDEACPNYKVINRWGNEEETGFGRSAIEVHWK